MGRTEWNGSASRRQASAPHKDGRSLRDVDQAGQREAEADFIGVALVEAYEGSPTPEAQLDWFADGRFRAIFETIQCEQSRLGPDARVDPWTVMQAIPAAVRESYPDLQRMAFFSELMDEATDRALTSRSVVPVLREYAVRRRHRLMIEELAQTSPQDFDEVVNKYRESAPVARTSRLVGDGELGRLGELRPLVGDLIAEGELVVIHGPEESLKTFATLDLALGIAYDRPALGEPIHRTGPVVFIAAEGQPGLEARVNAWKSARGVSDANKVKFLPYELALLDSEAVGDLIQECRQLAPLAFVIDPLALCMGDGDENATRDMSLAIRSMNRLQAAFGAVVFVNHHNGHNGDLRGSTTLKAAADVRIKFIPSADRGSVRVECKKMKNRNRFAPFTLRKVVVGGSCVLERADVAEPEKLPEKALKALDVLSQDFGDDGAAFGAWRKKTGIPESTFARLVKELVGDGRVTKDPDTGHYRLHSHYSHGTPMGVTESGPALLPPLSHTFKGVRGGSEGPPDDDLTVELAVTAFSPTEPAPEPTDPELSEATACHACGSEDFWAQPSGLSVCSRCHPEPGDLLS
jgi:hypothetical protein